MKLQINCCFTETYTQPLQKLQKDEQSSRQIIRQTGSTDMAEQCMNVFLTNKNTSEMHCKDQFQASCTNLRNQYEAMERVGAWIDI